MQASSAQCVRPVGRCGDDVLMRLMWLAFAAVSLLVLAPDHRGAGASVKAWHRWPNQISPAVVNITTSDADRKPDRPARDCSRRIAIRGLSFASFSDPQRAMTTAAHAAVMRWDRGL